MEKLPKDLQNLIYEFSRSRTLDEIHLQVVQHLISRKVFFLNTQSRYLLSENHPAKMDWKNMLELDEIEQELVLQTTSEVEKNIQLMSLYYEYYFRLTNHSQMYLNEKIHTNICQKLVNKLLRKTVDV